MKTQPLKSLNSTQEIPPLRGTLSTAALAREQLFQSWPVPRERDNMEGFILEHYVVVFHLPVITAEQNYRKPLDANAAGKSEVEERPANEE